MPTTALPPHIVEAYTNGDCWVLAQEMHRLTGWELWVVGQTLEGSTIADPRRWSHMLVRSTTDDFVDVQGVSTTEQLMDRYGGEDGSRLLPVPAAQVRAFLAAQHRFYPGLQVTPTALRVLRHYRTTV